MDVYLKRWTIMNSALSTLKAAYKAVNGAAETFGAALFEAGRAVVLFGDQSRARDIYEAEPRRLAWSTVRDAAAVASLLSPQDFGRIHKRLAWSSIRYCVKVEKARGEGAYLRFLLSCMSLPATGKRGLVRHELIVEACDKLVPPRGKGEGDKNDKGEGDKNDKGEGDNTARQLADAVTRRDAAEAVASELEAAYAAARTVLVKLGVLPPHGTLADDTVSLGKYLARDTAKPIKPIKRARGKAVKAGAVKAVKAVEATK